MTGAPSRPSQPYTRIDGHLPTDVVENRRTSLISDGVFGSFNADDAPDPTMKARLVRCEIAERMPRHYSKPSASVRHLAN
jgi:hypothetical protein